MADEIQMSARLYASKNGASINAQTWNVTCNMTGTDMGQQTQVVGPSSELLDITADLSLPFKLFIYNMDLVNEIGVGNIAAHVGQYWIRVPPQQFILIPYVDTDVYVRSYNSSVVKIFAQYCEI